MDNNMKHEKLLDYDFTVKVRTLKNFLNNDKPLISSQICVASNKHSNFEEPLIQFQFEVDSPKNPFIDFELTKDDLSEMINAMENVIKEK